MDREYYELYLPPVFKKSAKRTYRAPVQWSDERLEYLRENFATKFNKDLGAALGCNWRTVIRKARELGLEKEEGFLDKKRPEIVKLQIGSQRPNPMKGVKGWSVPGGEAYRFKPGNVPASKTKPEVTARLHASRNASIRRDRLRIKLGLPQLTKMKLVV
jgi:hypothetical protein